MHVPAPNMATTTKKRLTPLASKSVLLEALGGDTCYAMVGPQYCMFVVWRV